MDEFWSLVLGVRDTGKVLSGRVRRDVHPPDAAFHMELDGKEYLVLVQPTELTDAEELEEPGPEDPAERRVGTGDVPG